MGIIPTNMINNIEELQETATALVRDFVESHCFVNDNVDIRLNIKNVKLDVLKSFAEKKGLKIYEPNSITQYYWASLVITDNFYIFIQTNEYKETKTYEQKN